MVARRCNTAMQPCIHTPRNSTHSFIPSHKFYLNNNITAWCRVMHPLVLAYQVLRQEDHFKFKTTWATKGAQGQPGLHTETLSQKHTHTQKDRLTNKIAKSQIRAGKIHYSILCVRKKKSGSTSQTPK